MGSFAPPRLQCWMAASPSVSGSRSCPIIRVSPSRSSTSFRWCGMGRSWTAGRLRGAADDGRGTYAHRAASFLSGDPPAGVRDWGRPGIRLLPAELRPPCRPSLRTEVSLEAARVSDQVPSRGDGFGLSTRSRHRQLDGTSPPPRRTTDDPNRRAIMSRTLGTLLLIAAAAGGPLAAQDTSKAAPAAPPPPPAATLPAHPAVPP